MSSSTSSKMKLTANAPEGLVYHRDFEMPRDVSSCSYDIELFCYVVKFRGYQFVTPELRMTHIHTSELFRLEDNHSLIIVSPRADCFDAYVVLRRATRRACSDRRDLITIYAEGIDKYPIFDKATMLGNNEITSDLKHILDTSLFIDSDVTIWRMSDQIIEAMVKNPGHELSCLLQIQKTRDRLEPNVDREVFAPEGPFCDLTIKLGRHNEEYYDAPFEYVRVNKNVMASRSRFFKNELLKMSERARLTCSQAPRGHHQSQQFAAHNGGGAASAAAAAAAAANATSDRNHNSLNNMMLAGYANELDLSTVSAGTFKKLLNYFYYNKIDPITFGLKEAMDMYRTVHELQVYSLKRPFLDRIAFLLFDADNASIFSALEMSHRYDIRPLRKLIIALVKKFSVYILAGKDWDSFKKSRPDLVADLLQSVTRVN